MNKIKVVFLGQKPYSTLILNSLKKDRQIEILKIIEDRNSLDELKNLKDKPDIGILANFGIILGKDTLNIPRKGFLNIHPSLLPQYRGPSPVQTAILDNKKETGVTILKWMMKLITALLLLKVKKK